MDEEIKPRVGSRWTQPVGVLFLVFLSTAIAILVQLRNHSREEIRGSQCRSNLWLTIIAVKQYTQDYDGKYPLSLALHLDHDWNYTLMPYVRSPQVFQCPGEKTVLLYNPSNISQFQTDYWFNAQLLGATEKKIANPALLIALGDGADTINARYHLMSVPAKWRQDENSPLYRHLDGANYAFADGHVKWFSASRWKNESDMSGGPTFRLKPKN